MLPPDGKHGDPPPARDRLQIDTRVTAGGARRGVLPLSRTMNITGLPQVCQPARPGAGGKQAGAAPAHAGSSPTSPTGAPQAP